MRVTDSLLLTGDDVGAHHLEELYRLFSTLLFRSWRETIVVGQFEPGAAFPDPMASYPRAL